MPGKQSCGSGYLLCTAVRIDLQWLQASGDHQPAGFTPLELACASARANEACPSPHKAPSYRFLRVIGLHQRLVEEHSVLVESTVDVPSRT